MKVFLSIITLLLLSSVSFAYVFAQCEANRHYQFMCCDGYGHLTWITRGGMNDDWCRLRHLYSKRCTSKSVINNYILGGGIDEYCKQVAGSGKVIFK